eukprot:3126729-Pleurochrysis_carterae.AAC.1
MRNSNTRVSCTYQLLAVLKFNSCSVDNSGAGPSTSLSPPCHSHESTPPPAAQATAHAQRNDVLSEQARFELPILHLR